MNFIQYLNFRYGKVLNKLKVDKFKYYDDYILFLYESISNKDKDKYYSLLEEDIRLYSNYQTGSERECSDKKWIEKKDKKICKEV